MEIIWRKALIIPLLISILSLLIAPAFMPEDYSWVSNTTSESAAQGLANAWIARLGFVSFGLAVIWQSVLTKNTWSKVARINHFAFGVSMLLVAAFSKRHWDVAMAFDPTDDFLHSVFATLMGFAFSFGVLFVFLKRAQDLRGKALDVLAIASSIGIPLLMLEYKDIGGLVQRLMFGVSYAWYLKELVINTGKK